MTSISTMARHGGQRIQSTRELPAPHMLGRLGDRGPPRAWLSTKWWPKGELKAPVVTGPAIILGFGFRSASPNRRERSGCWTALMPSTIGPAERAFEHRPRGDLGIAQHARVGIGYSQHAAWSSWRRKQGGRGGV